MVNAGFELLDYCLVLAGVLDIFEDFDEFEHESTVMNLPKYGSFRLQFKQLLIT
jgi:hypothetical protein